MRQRVPRRRLERVPERVTEVELVPRPAVVRVGDADARLERRAPAHELRQRQLPDAVAHQQARLHGLGHPVRELLVGQRLERAGVDHDPRRPVEGADEVLAAGKVDGGLAADRRVDLADEGRRHRHPRHAPHVRRGGEARQVGRAAAAEGEDRAVPPDPQRAPEPLEHGDRLRVLAGRNLVQRDVAVAERELGGDAVDARDVAVGDDLDRPAARRQLLQEVERADPDVDPGSGEDDAVGVVGARVGRLLVERQPLAIERVEGLLVERERPPARGARALPGDARLDLEQDGEGAAGEDVARRRPTAPCRRRARRPRAPARRARRPRSPPRWRGRRAPRRARRSPPRWRRSAARSRRRDRRSAVPAAAPPPGRASSSPRP